MSELSPGKPAQAKPFATRYGRTITYAINTAIALIIYFSVTQAITVRDLQFIRLSEYFGFAALLNLYVALLISPLYFVFPALPFRGAMLHIRRALGISTFLFAFIHANISFFKLLQGFNGLAFLGDRQTVDIWLGALALFILFLMAGTSFDYFFKKMGKWWGRLHRFVYLAGTIILVHIIAVGSHFTDLSRPLPVVVVSAVFGLLVLQAFRFARLMEKKIKNANVYKVTLSILVFVLLALYFYMLFIAKSVSIHRH
jgi:sulfoxide reductase heme-binding subunit YedZ